MTIGELQAGKKVLCKECGTKSYRNIEAEERKKFEDYGFIVVHRKNCAYLKKLMKNSVGVK